MKSTLLSVALILEEDIDKARPIRGPTAAEEEVRKAVMAAVAVLLRDGPVFNKSELKDGPRPVITSRGHAAAVLAFGS
jgi:hypothetical protein